MDLLRTASLIKPGNSAFGNILYLIKYFLQSYFVLGNWSTAGVCTVFSSRLWIPGKQFLAKGDIDCVTALHSTIPLHWGLWLKSNLCSKRNILAGVNKVSGRLSSAQNSVAVTKNLGQSSQRKWNIAEFSLFGSTWRPVVWGVYYWQRWSRAEVCVLSRFIER